MLRPSPNHGIPVLQLPNDDDLLVQIFFKFLHSYYVNETLLIMVDAYDLYNDNINSCVGYFIGIQSRSYLTSSHCKSLILASPGLNINSIIHQSSTPSVNGHPNSCSVKEVSNIKNLHQRWKQLHVADICFLCKTDAFIVHSRDWKKKEWRRDKGEITSGTEPSTGGTPSPRK